jgi:hypothetical protein
MRMRMKSPSIASPSIPRFTVADYSQARRNYEPEKIRVLLVAESPPSSGGYFYFNKTIGKDHLFRETMKALHFWPRNKSMRSGIDKTPMLKKFQSEGFFLIDTCELPVDRLSPKERMIAIHREANGLASRTRRLNPTYVVVVKKTVYHSVRDAFIREGLDGKILNKKPLYFPSHGNQAKFRTTLRRLIRSVDRVGR